MKKALTERDIIEQYRRGERQIACGADTIMTPSAKEAARKYGMKILEGGFCCDEKLISDEDVKMIVQEVAKRIGKEMPADFVKEADKSGIQLVRGGTVICESFDTGNPADKVGIKEILTRKESPNMATGFMTFEKSAFDWTLGYDELDYIIEGDLDIVVDGTAYHGHKGDVFFIPMGTSITFSVPNQCKFFFATYPANWQELSGK